MIFFNSNNVFFRLTNNIETVTQWFLWWLWCAIIYSDDDNNYNNKININNNSNDNNNNNNDNDNDHDNNTNNNYDITY